MKLNNDQVKKVAKLANLPITEEETEKYSQQLSAILDYIDQLDKAPTQDVIPTYNVSGQINVIAPDVVRESLTQEESLQNATQKKDGFFITKGVFSDE
jgi:aspartyl-tRNA(Asn)/glutamyl-tRNA(Gln) amidotransferase subunit C